MEEKDKGWKLFEDWKEASKWKTENEYSLFNFQFFTINDLQNQNAMALQNLIDRRSQIFYRPNNPELEYEFRIMTSAYRNDPKNDDSQLAKAYQDYINAYNQKTSLYLIDRFNNLYIYNTESDKKETKPLETPKPLVRTTCITQLPNGKLFCYGKYPGSGITMIIDENNSNQILPSGTPCRSSSAIYFNHNVYCFGGKNKDDARLALSARFDLCQNRWIKLTSLPQPESSCNSVIFNGNILISGYLNRNLLLYSIDIDSFSIIPYDFAKKKRKILINAERLYLIECNSGSIYESEVGSDTNWRWIADSTIKIHPYQAYCSYNKGKIYIGCIRNEIEYFKFNLDEKKLVILD